ncbi:carbon-nitrogen hydrolase family protein [Pseudonocardia broussonetiae]|uniref:Carbon-nitrogen hydrolase family protein n=1 Tax=Pseudonocardia broussonetiae TaxID=2736640 RepID=A0A6M6JGD7_9PSEU|nr:carbon-nitrogen hydrolase family protein [Pseudonocardia broussonetiae]QJY46110.1 carbon-nitrogen hydrolase family protein [Pseudonocardia broussonetiae]
MPRLAAAAAAFGPDLEFDLRRVGTLIEHARRDGADLLVLPAGALGGHVPGAGDPSIVLDLDDPVLERVARLAGPLVVCVGFRQRTGGGCHNAAVCLHGDGVLGTHHKVHLPPGEAAVYAPGCSFDAFDTPVGRIGMLIDYDKTFPESARSLALDGAQVLACLSAWPTSTTHRAPRMNDDRQSRLFDLYDRARAAENQVVLVSSNQTGSHGGTRFLGQAKVVGPDGDVLARTWGKAGIATADVDVPDRVREVRRVLHHLVERRPETYR